MWIRGMHAACLIYMSLALPHVNACITPGVSCVVQRHYFDHPCIALYPADDGLDRVPLLPLIIWHCIIKQSGFVALRQARFRTSNGLQSLDPLPACASCNLYKFVFLRVGSQALSTENHKRRCGSTARFGPEPSTNTVCSSSETWR